jgi:uncharacterized protein (TIGR03000 family)
MYSVVLMMALTGSAETTEFGGSRCCGCSGVAVSCCAKTCGGGGHRIHHRCSGACSGAAVCSGASACSGGLFHRHARCCGCTGAPVCPPACCGTAPAPAPAPAPKATIETRRVAPATIVVMVPADARLTVDGNATTSATARRVLVTPALEVGSDYVYNLTASVVVDGETVTQTQLVTVRGGRTNEVSFDFASTVASR